MACLPFKIGVRLVLSSRGRLICFCGLKGSILVATRLYIKSSRVCGMDSDFDNALVSLRDTIQNFDFNSFANKNTVS
jgi:hypothetical protein